MIRILPCLPGSDVFESWDDMLPQLYAPEQLAMKKLEPVDEEKLRIALLALKDDVPVGRLALYYNPSIQYEGGKTMLIGQFECVEEEAVAEALLESAAGWALQEEALCLVGPMNGSTWHSYRFTITEGLPPFFSEALHPLYYPQFFIRNGFEVAHRYHTTIGSAEENPVDELLLKEMNDAGLRIRGIDVENYGKELRKIHALCAVAFAGNAFFSPASEAEFLQQQLPYRSLMDPRFVKLAERDGTLLAFVFAFEDRLSPGRLVVKTIAKLPSAPKGLISLMTQQVYAEARAARISTVLHAYMHTQNKSLRLSTVFGARPYKEHVLLVKKLPHA